MKNEAQFGSHKVTILRHGSSHDFYKDEQDGEASFHYNGYSLTSGKFQVVIKNEEVIVNGKVYGHLNVGDSVNINDDGVTVNSMGNVETSKYLQKNSEQARP
jgi:hypothetical protein